MQVKRCDCQNVAVTVKEIVVHVSVMTQPEVPVVEVQIPGERGLSAIDKPFDEDPTDIYLKARGDKYGNENEQ